MLYYSSWQKNIWIIQATLGFIIALGFFLFSCFLAFFHREFAWFYALPIVVLTGSVVIYFFHAGKQIYRTDSNSMELKLFLQKNYNYACICWIFLGVIFSYFIWIETQ